METKNNTNFINKMLGLFGSREHNGRIMPDNPLITGKKTGRRGYKLLPENTPLSVLWNFFLTEQYDTYETLKNRENRYIDLDFAVKNNPIIQMSADLYADEAVQCQESGSPVRVNARSEVQSEITGLLELWGIDQQTVRETIWNKVVFGDSFDTNDIDQKEGILKVTPIHVQSVKDRLEFNPSKLLEQLKFFCNNNGVNPSAKLSALQKNLERERANPSNLFNKYLLGFELEGGHMVSPWSVTHYRAFSLLREFEPWGRSRFINVLPTFRQLMSSEGLMQVARASSFPRDLYLVATEMGATTTEKWEALEEFSEQLDNAGLYEGSKETPSIGSRLIMPKDLAEYQQLSNSLDLDKIADIEYLRDNLIMGTSIPKGYLIVDQGGWGTSGQSLLQQFKPFGRKVFSDQSDYLAGLTEKIKIHLSIVNKFEGYDTPFELIMDFPVIEESSDRLNHRSDELSLAKETLETIKDTLGVDNVPPEIVKDCFGIMTSLSQAKIDLYVDKIMKANENEQEENSFDEKQTKTKKRQNYEKVVNRLKERSTQDILKERSIIKKSEMQMPEGSGRGIHYRSSLKKSQTEASLRNLYETLCTDDDEKKFLTECLIKE
ncbi:MAG: hypothetical protein ACRCZB_05380 [Bacteroidales bacterium]